MMSMTCSKHVENYKQINTLKRMYASSWAITKNHCMMHGQQNVKSNDISRYRRGSETWRVEQLDLSTAVRYRQGSIPGRDGDFSLLHIVQRSCCFYPMDIWRSSGIKRPGHEADRPQYNNGDDNGWTCTSI